MVSAPAQAPNAVRLLWEIGLEGQRLWEPWNWGPLADSPFVPRVRYGHFVLASAVWRLDGIRARAEELRARSDDARVADWDRAIGDWRAAWDVPPRILAVTADQRLLLDLGNTWHRELLLDQVLRHSDLIAQEVPGEYEDWLDSPLAGHTFELVVPLTRRETDTPRRRPYAGHRQPGRTVHGLAASGSTSNCTAPPAPRTTCCATTSPNWSDLAGQKGADGWFFIRYTDDGGHHLRLRLHGDSPKELWGKVAPAAGALLQRWQREGLLRSHTLAQYDPETERYGGPAAQRLAEDVFRYDSEAVIELLRVAKDPANDYDVDDLAVVSCAALASAFGPPAPGNVRGTEDCGDDGAAAWLSMTGARRDLPAAFRARPAQWRRLVDPYGGWPVLVEDPAGARVLDALRPRDEAVRQLATCVRDSGDTPEGRVVGSLLHMVCNRLFGGSSARELTVLGIARGAVQDHLNRRRHQS
ncbi:thiopeptide-type bacteriocin biosynthesis protein [Streptomyces lydicus]|uniref:thiopeptide-type bacteriocin biosynthesis protein n=1 Tax=Streptomyces lydicus TaxID=47763 RepID=UPI00240DEFFA|nr:lantibiotic dehydratase [Streptomyces lydicus]